LCIRFARSVIEIIKNREGGYLVALFLIKKESEMKIVNWITGRLSEPSSYAAIGVGVIGIGMIAGVGELLFIGVACAVLGLILAEEAKKDK